MTKGDRPKKSGQSATRHAELAQQKTKKAKPRAFDFSGRWSNELGSYMDVIVQGDKVKGEYVSAVSDDGEPLPAVELHGMVAGDLISFTVNWWGTSITTWIGHGVIDPDQGPQILTLWHLVLKIPDETDPETQWQAIKSGADTFSR